MNDKHLMRLRRVVDIVERDPRLMDRPHPIGVRANGVPYDPNLCYFRVYSSGTSMGSPAFFYYTLIPQVYDIVADEFIDNEEEDGMECYGRPYTATDDFITDQIVVGHRVALCDNVGDAREDGLFYLCYPLVPSTSSGSGTLFAFFTLPSSLTTSNASKASCTVNAYFGGADPGATITVYNVPASSNYIFSASSGKKGIAVYDADNSKFWIIQLEC